MRGQAPSNLGCDTKSIFRTRIHDVCDDLFRTAVTIYIRRIYEGDTIIQGSVQSRLASFSLTEPHEPPTAHAPNPISETFTPVRPNDLLSILISSFQCVGIGTDGVLSPIFAHQQTELGEFARGQQFTFLDLERRWPQFLQQAPKQGTIRK